MGENHLHLVPQPEGEDDTSVESPKALDETRQTRLNSLLGDVNMRIIPRDTGGQIIISRLATRYTVFAQLPHHPDFKRYEVTWSLGLPDSDSKDAILIVGEKNDGTPFGEHRLMNQIDDTATLDDVLDKAEETTRIQAQRRGNTGDRSA